VFHDLVVARGANKAVFEFEAALTVGGWGGLEENIRAFGDSANVSHLQACQTLKRQRDSP